MKQKLLDARSLSPGDLCIPLWLCDDYTYVIKPDREFEFIIGKSFKNENKMYDVIYVIVQNGKPRIERISLQPCAMFIHGIKL